MGASQSTDGLAIAALVLGLASIALFWVFGIVPVVAIVLGGIAISRTGREGRGGRNMAIAGTVLGTLGVVAFVALMIVVSLDDDESPSPVEPRSPTGEETIEIPRPTSSTSIDEVFAPIAGYTMSDAPPSVIANIRSEVENEPAARAVLVDVGGRSIKQNGRTVAQAIAMTFDEGTRRSSDIGDGFVNGAAGEFLTRQERTLAGQRAVFGSDTDGEPVIVVYKNGVGLVVAGSPNVVVLEQITIKLLANIPAVS